MNKLINLPAVGLALCLGGESLATEPFATTIEDHNKTVIKKIPQTVEICSHGNGKSDLENFITGAILNDFLCNSGFLRIVRSDCNSTIDSSNNFLAKR